MHIAIDVSPLESGHKTRGTGIYTRELVNGFKKFGGKHTFEFIHHGQKVSEKADLIHYPYFDPFFLTLPLRISKPFVVTVHDLIPLVFPDKFPPGLRGTVKWKIQKESLKKSRRIITDSESSKRDIHIIVGIKEEKIDVVPLAQSNLFHPVKVLSQLQDVKKKYNLPDKYVLYVGDVNWNKNVTGLLEAYSLFIHKNPSLHIPLVLVGGSFHNEALKEVVAINTLIRVLNISDSVRKLGFIPDNELGYIYSQATCVIQPSYYEGFGFPVLEAMASGCPVITSESSSLAEIAGPSVRVQPENMEQIAVEILRMARLSQIKRAKLVKEGLAWTANFTWQKVIAGTISVYEKALK